MADKLRRMKDRASRMYAEGKLRDALGLYERIVEADERELGCRIKIGDLLRRMGDLEEAVDCYEAVARIYAEEGYLLKAIAVCKLILAVDPHHSLTQHMLADLYSRRKAGTPHVPALPVSPAEALEACQGQDDVLAAWPSGTRVIDLEQPSEGASNHGGDPAILAAWPVSQPVAVFPDGSMWPLIKGQALQEELDAIDEIEIVEDEEPTSEASSEPEGYIIELIDIVGDDVMIVPEEELSSAEATTGPPFIPLFSELPKKAFVEILVRMTMHELRRGETVLREGDNGDSFYIVASGLVSVSRLNSEGKEVCLAHLSDGAFFGEMALLQEGRRTATVRVEEDSQIFEISRPLLEEVIAQYPTVATAVRNFYRQRLLATAMATHVLFEPFPLEERQNLMEQFKSRSYAPGEIILEEGKKGSGLYLLLHGEVEVSKDLDGEQVGLAQLRAGDLFGEISLLTNEPVSATITAMEDVFVLRLSKRRFDEMVLSNESVLDFVAQLSEMRTEENQALVASQLHSRGAVLV